MERTIAVEEGLRPVKEILTRKGYHVVGLDAKMSVAAAVVSGMDINMMDMQTMEIDAPVINAAGMSPEEVLREVESKILH